MQNAIQTILRDGGLIIWALLVLAVVIYTLLAAVWWHCRHVRRRIEAGDWQRSGRVDAGLPWKHREADRRQVERDVATFELEEMAWVERRLPFLGILVGVAPLLGLLGTVAGMLVTFGGMSSAIGGEPIDHVSAGISKAMVTTQAGLVIAVPAAFLLVLLQRSAGLAHAELQRQLHQRLATIGAGS